MTREERIEARIAENEARKAELNDAIQEARAVKNRAKVREWQMRDPEAERARVATRARRSRANNPELCRAQVKKWRANNPDKVALHKRSRKLRIKIINELLPGEWERIVDRCDNRCIVPGCGVSPVTKDHVVPLFNGGRHHVSNLQPLCRACNSRKGLESTDYRTGEQRVALQGLS